MRKFLLTAAVVTASFSGPALATDLGLPPSRPVYAPALVPFTPLYSWTGCYVGGNGGGFWARRDWSDPVFGRGEFGDQTASGGLGGIQAGCNYQVRRWVFGVQGDWDWASGSHSDVNIAFPRFTDQSQSKSLASLTLRAGYAWERFLLYVKGGGAWLRTDFTLQTAGAVFPTVSETREMWTIGVGGEYAFLDWLTGFIEYDRYGHRNDNDTIGFTCGAACPIATINTFPVDVSRTNVNVVKAGLNLKFGPNTRWGW
jgi:outer membrane immunogenic protein